MKYVGKLLPTPLILNEKRWYFLSIFYARESWITLITQIIRYYQKRPNQFCNCLLSFSEDNINVTFVSLLNADNYLYDIQNHFQLFVNQNPSVEKNKLSFDKTVWGNFPNNSLTWNKFILPDYSEQCICFHQQTTDLILKLTGDDFSADSILSLGIYLLTKGLSCIDGDKQKNVLSQTLHEISVDIEINIINELIKDKIDIEEISETIESYINENVNEYSPELIKWLNGAKVLLKFHDYQYFCASICKILGLNTLQQLMILKLMNIRYNRQ
ncbi:MAG: hypothetical protein FWF53_09040 [Candidatus Azobacteroides sp.]|nr:hypothetical protein [Candidatus Azobacteroides sp.]